jgi:hypothetical protein
MYTVSGHGLPGDPFRRSKKGIIFGTDRITMRTDIRIGNTIAFSEGAINLTETKIMDSGEQMEGMKTPTEIACRRVDTQVYAQTGGTAVSHIAVVGVVAQLGRVAVCEDRTPHDSTQCFYLSTRSRGESSCATRANTTSAPAKWEYFDPLQRTTPDSIVTSIRGTRACPITSSNSPIYPTRAREQDLDNHGDEDKDDRARHEGSSAH